MESQKIGFKTCILAWLVYSVSSLVFTLLLIFMSGIGVGIMMAGHPTEEVTKVASSVGMIAVFPIGGLCSLVCYLASAWFFFMRKQDAEK